MSSSDERARAFQTVSTDWTKGLEKARKVSDAWFRCQSLAAVARYAPEGEVSRIANEALKAAALGKDEYRRVAVAAWPVRALVERGKVGHLGRILPPLLEEAGRIEHPVSRISALCTLWQAVWPSESPVKQDVLDTLLAGCQLANSWKAGRIMRFVALVIATEDREWAQRIIDSMRESVYKRKAQRELDTEDFTTVRLFFP